MTKTRILLTTPLFALATIACNNGWNPTGNNGEEVAQFLPEDVTLDVSEMPDSEADTAKPRRPAAAGPETESRGHAMNTCGGVIHGFHRAAARALALGAAIREDMTDPSNVLIAGEFEIGDKKVPYLADFSAFDFDGDGTPDGSGNAVDVPVALRLWTDRGEGYEPFLCALIATKPTEKTDESEANLGAGQMYVKPAAPRLDEAADLQMFLQWDRTDPAHKWNEAFVTGELKGNFRFSASHHRVDHRTYEDEHVEKTVRTSATFSENPLGFETFKSSTHFSRGSGAALFSVESTGTNATISFTDVCVNFETKEIDATACEEFDTADVDFINEPTGDETAFPADFPAEPTFTPEQADNAGATDDNANDNDDDDGNDNAA